MKQLAFKAVGALAILAVLFVSGIGQSASIRIASADDDEARNAASRESPTDVVLKLKPKASIESVIEKIESWDTSRGKGKQGSKRNGSGNYSVELTKQFPGTDIYLLHLTSGNATALANQLAALKEVVWAEAGIFTPSSEASQFRQVSYERFSQAAYDRFSQAAYDQFRQAVGLMRIGHARRPHFVQDDRHAAAGDLPGGLATGEPAADHVDGLHLRAAHSQ